MECFYVTITESMFDANFNENKIRVLEFVPTYEL